MPPHDHPLRKRLVRYADLIPCYNAFIDTRSPGSEAKENFTIIGPGVSENLQQHVHIAEPHGFNIGGARQPPHCVNSQHSHETAEVFVVLSGEWSFNIGETGEDARIHLSPGDVISIPTNVFRGFENVGSDIGYLWAVLGGDNPGRVLWAPYVFQMANDYGLMLMENGSLVDTVKGEEPPAGVSPMTPTDSTMAARVDRLDADAVRRCVVTVDEYRTLASGPLSSIDGVDERAVIGPDNEAEKIAAGKMGWSHGFHLRQVVMAAGAAVPAHSRPGPQVLFVQKGEVIVQSGADQVTMVEGDTLTVPLGQACALRSVDGATLFMVHGGDAPSPASWNDQSAMPA